MASKSAKSEKAQEMKTVDQPRELSEHMWSVVSFERVEASGLTYSEAADKIKECAEAGLTGLCLVTDTAAARMRR